MRCENWTGSTFGGAKTGLGPLLAESDYSDFRDCSDYSDCSEYSDYSDCSDYSDFSDCSDYSDYK